MNITEKAAYIKGLAEGLELGDTKQDKLIKELIGFVSELADSVAECAEKNETLADYCDELDEDLGAVEEYVYGAGEEDGCSCGDDELYTFVCPHCNESFFLDEDDFDLGEVECPYCGEMVDVGDREDYVKELDASDDCDDCGCGCHGKN